MQKLISFTELKNKISSEDFKFLQKKLRGREEISLLETVTYLENWELLMFLNQFPHLQTVKRNISQKFLEMSLQDIPKNSNLAVEAIQLAYSLVFKENIPKALEEEKNKMKTRLLKAFQDANKLPYHDKYEYKLDTLYWYLNEIISNTEDVTDAWAIWYGLRTSWEGGNFKEKAKGREIIFSCF